MTGRWPLAAAAAAVAGAMALALGAQAGSSDPWALRVTVGSIAPDLVIAGRGSRPVWSFVVVAPDGGRDVGSASVDWLPSGRELCASGPAPLGDDGTTVLIRFHTPAAIAGTTVAQLSRPAGCTMASGAWRGGDGPLRGRRGDVTLRVDDTGIVRLSFDGLALSRQ